MYPNTITFSQLSVSGQLFVGLRLHNLQHKSRTSTTQTQRGHFYALTMLLIDVNCDLRLSLIKKCTRQFSCFMVQGGWKINLKKNVKNTFTVIMRFNEKKKIVFWHENHKIVLKIWTIWQRKYWCLLCINFVYENSAFG